MWQTLTHRYTRKWPSEKPWRLRAETRWFSVIPSIDFLSLPFVAHNSTQCKMQHKSSDPHTLHGTRPLNICSSCFATSHVVWLSIARVFLKVTFVCNGVSGIVNPCTQVPDVSQKCARSFHTCLIYFFAPYLQNCRQNFALKDAGGKTHGSWTQWQLMVHLKAYFGVILVPQGYQMS